MVAMRTAAMVPARLMRMPSRGVLLCRVAACCPMLRRPVMR